jgi:two-component system, OmpR family, response regulator VanR
MRVLIVEDEPYLAEAIRDGLRLEAIAADIAGEGETALELLSINAYDIAVLDRDIPGPSGDEIAKRIVASGSGMPILMLTAADRLDDKASGFELGADDYLTKPFDLRELVLRLSSTLSISRCEGKRVRQAIEQRLGNCHHVGVGR